jgi:hypothetical protein
MKVPQLAHFSWYHKMQETKVPLKLKNKGTFFSECATAFLSRLVGHTLCLEQLYGCLFQPLYTCSAPGQVFVLCSWSIPRINVQFSQNPLASVEVEQEHTLCLEQLYAVNSGQFCDSARKQLGPIWLLWTLCSVTAHASCSDQQSEGMLDQDWVLMQAKTGLGSYEGKRKIGFLWRKTEDRKIGFLCRMIGFLWWKMGFLCRNTQGFF